MSRNLKHKIARLENRRPKQTGKEGIEQARKFVDFLVEWGNNEGLSPQEEVELARKHGLEVTPEGVVKSGL